MSDLVEIKKALDETMGNIKSAVETQQAEIKK